MKNLVQTQSIAWAQGLRVALEAEGIRAAILDEHDRGAIGVLGYVRVVVLNDGDLERAQAVVTRLTPPRTGPPRSWRWQKRGLLLLALDVGILLMGTALYDHYESQGRAIPSALTYTLDALIGILLLTGLLLVLLGPRADKARSSP
jgi:hypothetical protein